jgi:hypothetical protein
MLHWLIDNATLFYVLLICTACGLLAGWWVTRKQEFLAALGIIAAIAGLLFLLTLLIDTDRKKITRALQEMVAGVRNQDLERTFSHIADDCTTQFSNRKFSRDELRQQTENAIRSRGVETIRLWDFAFESVDSQRAVVTFSAKPFGKWATGSEFCGCRAEFRREANGKWRMINLQLFDPGTTNLLNWPL